MRKGDPKMEQEVVINRSGCFSELLAKLLPTPLGACGPTNVPLCDRDARFSSKPAACRDFSLRLMLPLTAVCRGRLLIRCRPMQCG